jgi:hypothetical protein
MLQSDAFRQQFSLLLPNRWLQNLTLCFAVYYGFIFQEIYDYNSVHISEIVKMTFTNDGAT